MERRARRNGNMYLLADLGGTHARFLLLPADRELSREPFPAASRLDLAAQDFPGFDAVIAAACEKFDVLPGGTEVALAVAGPVTDQKVFFTNLDWHIDAGTLKAAFGFREVALVNDVAAAAAAIAGEVVSDHATLQPGSADAASRKAVISVGTGLGVACWTDSGGKLRIDATEAGHAGVAPADEWQSEWLQQMRRSHGRVSWERMLSGSGLCALEAWLRGGQETSAADVVKRAGVSGSAAARAVHKFCQLLGVFAGDLVLAAPASGGIWMAGGVLAGMGAVFDRAAFLEGFHAKGRFRAHMESIPVYWTRDRELGLRGAWQIAAHRIPRPSAEPDPYFGQMIV